MSIRNFGGYNSKLWVELGDMYDFFLVMSAVLRYILFYLKEIYMKLEWLN